MALRTINIGAVEDAFQWDDAVTPFYSDGSTPVGLVVPLAPTVDNAVVRKVDLTSGGVNPLADLQYVVMALSSVVPNERKLTAGTGVTLTDGGAGGNATLAIGQAVATSDSPTFVNVNATGEFRVDGTKVIGNQESAITSLTDSTGGSANNTLEDVTTLGLADPAKVNNNFADLAAKVNAIFTVLRNHGLIAT